ncbi:MAG: aminotransferase, partial [Sphingobacteriales bacterium]
MKRIIEYENLARLNEPFFEAYSAVFDKTMRKGWYILGEQVKLFENAFADYVGTKHA